MSDQGVPPTSCEPDQAWKALTLVNDWVKHAETKSATTLAASGVTGGVLYNLVKDQSNPGWWLTIFGGACGVGVLLAGAFALLALTPRTGRISRLVRWVKGKSKAAETAEASGDPGEEADNGPSVSQEVEVDADPSNLLFFGDIARDYADDTPTYIEVLAALTSDKERLTAHIARQVHANAGVAHRKFRWAERAIRALAVALAALAGVALVVGERAGA